jgi:LPS-assembly protein
VKPIQSICWTALPLLLASPALAQPIPEEVPPMPVEAPEATAPVERQEQPGSDPLIPGDPDTPIYFSADRVEYDEPRETIVASGDVYMFREGYRLLADRVIWTRSSGEVRADGNVRVSTPEGDRAYGTEVVLQDTLRDGVIENLLLVLEDGGRLAANRATRVNNV